MKNFKKAAVLLCVAVVSMTSVTACGNKGSETSKEESKKVDYMSWTASDWEDASDKEKIKCAREYSIYSSEAMGIEMTDEQKDTLTDENLEQVVTALDALFAVSEDKTLKESVDDSLDAAGDAIEEAAESVKEAE